MLLWTAIAVMTGLAVLTVLVPLARSNRAAITPAAHDAAVYRDQLAEIDRDRERGLIAAVEADAARAEVARRLLAVAPADDTPSPKQSTFRRRAAAALALVMLPGLALGSYLVVGSPQLPAQPLAARLAAIPDQEDITALVRRVEAHLAQTPDDGRGWDILAPVYMRMGRFRESANAASNAIRLLGPTADRQAVLGEALVANGGGVITAEAKAAFQAALAQDRTSPRARFWVAKTAEQDGDIAGALSQYRALLADTPPDAPWRTMLQGEVARLSGEAPPVAAAPAPAAPAPAQSAARGPSQDEIAAAAGMAPAERQAMIRGMVDRLAERLRETPQDPDGWLRLVRAYAVLGDAGRAREAADEARRALSANAEAVAAIDALVRDLGLVNRGS